MKIWINEEEIEIFSGARVVDALRKYRQPENRAFFDLEKITVNDFMGNSVALDGELSPGDRLFLQMNDTKK